MISARRNARSAPPPHRGRRAGYRSLEFLASALVLCLCRNSFSYPSIILPKAPAHSAGPTSKKPGPLFGFQNRLQNFIRFLKAFQLPNWCPKPPKMMPKLLKDALFSRCVFIPFFLQCWKRFCLLFQAPDPRFHRQGRWFRGVHLFSQSRKKYPK